MIEFKKERTLYYKENEINSFNVPNNKLRKFAMVSFFRKAFEISYFSEYIS